MTTGAIAATKSDELAEKIGTELIQEYMSKANSGKEPTEAEFAKSFMEKCAAISVNSKKPLPAIALKSMAKKKQVPANA